jgi:uncharacterized protein (TIGR04255 family)
MTPRYKNPPLLEAACEFGFRLTESWDESVRDRFHDQIRERYPSRGRSVRQDLEASPLANEQGVGQTVNLSATEISVFADADRRTLIQLAPDTLTINVTTPYPSWAGVRPRIVEALEALEQSVRVETLTAARLIYIDQFVLPSNDPIDTYFTFRPHLAPDFPWLAADFYLGLHANEPDGSAYTIEIRSDQHDAGDTDQYLMRSEYAFDRELSVEAGVAWIETAHNRVNELFEASITNEMRALFNRGEAP